jgi:hypothetical protein
MKIRWLIAAAAVVLTGSLAWSQQSYPVAPPAPVAPPSVGSYGAPNQDYELVVEELTEEALTVAAKLCRAGRYNEAEFLLQKILRLDPNNVVARAAWVRVCQRMGKTPGQQPMTCPEGVCPPDMQVQCTEAATGSCRCGAAAVRTTSTVTPATRCVIGQAKDCSGPVCQIVVGSEGDVFCVCADKGTKCECCKEKCACGKECCCKKGCACGKECACKTTSCCASECCGKNCVCKTASCCCASECCCGTRSVSAPRTLYRVIAPLPQGIPCCSLTADGRVVVAPAAVAVRRVVPATQIYVITVPGNGEVPPGSQVERIIASIKQAVEASSQPVVLNERNYDVLRGPGVVVESAPVAAERIEIITTEPQGPVQRTTYQRRVTVVKPTGSDTNSVYAAPRAMPAPMPVIISAPRPNPGVEDNVPSNVRSSRQIIYIQK